MLIKPNRLFKMSAELKWRLVVYLASALMAFSILISAIFIYRYIYVTLDNANAVIVLNVNTSVNVVNLPAYNKAMAALKNKQFLISLPPAPRNIFSYATTTLTAPPAATTSAR